MHLVPQPLFFKLFRYYRSVFLPGWQSVLPPQFSQPQEQPPFPLRRFFTSRTTMAVKTRKTISPTIKVERFMMQFLSCKCSCKYMPASRHYLAASTARTEVKVLSAVPFRNRSQSKPAAQAAAATVPMPKLPPFIREPNWKMISAAA